MIWDTCRIKTKMQFFHSRQWRHRSCETTKELDSALRRLGGVMAPAVAHEPLRPICKKKQYDKDDRID